MRLFLFVFIIVTLCACSEEKITPKSGEWRAVLETMDGKELPFQFVYKSDNSLSIYNAEEIIEVDEVQITGDSIIIKMPVYEGVF